MPATHASAAAAPAATLKVTRLGKHLGAEISGLDTSRPPTDAEFQQILEAFHQHSVVRIRAGRGLPDRYVVDLSARFGFNKIHELKDFLDKQHPELLLVTNIMENGKPIGLKDSAIKWHADMTYTTQPNPISVLVGHEVCKVGGGTQFTSMYAAWETLPQKVKDRIENLTAMHSIANYKYKEGEGMTGEDQLKFPPVHHPAVLTHPVTGRKALYVSEGTAIALDGIPPDESRALLDMLFAHSVQEEFTWVQEWQVGDIVIWDNRCTMHRQMPYDPAERRLMKRTTIVTAKPGV
ncbi:MAG: TauD/TfdA dioxygenase family protein [Reyranellaceae bacterium]